MKKRKLRKSLNYFLVAVETVLTVLIVSINEITSLFWLFLVILIYLLIALVLFKYGDSRLFLEEE